MSGSGFGQYYVELAQEDYYTMGGEPLGQWKGSGAKALGLSGTVSKTELVRLFKGFSPDGLRPLVQNAGDDKRKSGDDQTYGVPKSLSVTWANAPAPERKKIAQCVEAALAVVIAKTESIAGETRRGKGGNIREKVGLVFAQFQHGSNRNLEPHLHYHLLLLNVGVRRDGTTGAIVSKNIYQRKMEFGRLFRSELAKELEKVLSLKLLRSKDYFEVAHVPQAVCKAFSTRRQEVLNALAKKGLSSAKAAKIAALDTRRAKEVLPRQQLFSAWQEKSQALGFGPREVARLFQDGQRPKVPKPDANVVTTVRSPDLREMFPANWRVQCNPGNRGRMATITAKKQMNSAPSLKIKAPSLADLNAQVLKLKPQLRAQDSEKYTLPGEIADARRTEFHQSWISKVKILSLSAEPTKSDPASDTKRESKSPNPAPHPQRAKAANRTSVSSGYWLRTLRPSKGKAPVDQGRLLLRVPGTALEFRLVKEQLFYLAPFWSPLRFIHIKKVVLARGGERMDVKPRRYSHPTWKMELANIRLSRHQSKLFPQSPIGVIRNLVVPVYALHVIKRKERTKDSVRPVPIEIANERKGIAGKNQEDPTVRKTRTMFREMDL